MALQFDNFEICTYFLLSYSRNLRLIISYYVQKYLGLRVDPGGKAGHVDGLEVHTTRHD